MEKADIIGGVYSEVWWDFHVERGVFTSVGLVSYSSRKPILTDRRPLISLAAILLPCLLSAATPYQANVDDAEVVLPNYAWTAYASGLTVGDIGVSTWYLSETDLQFMWKLVKHHRPDIAQAGVTFAKELAHADKRSN